MNNITWIQIPLVAFENKSYKSKMCAQVGSHNFVLYEIKVKESYNMKYILVANTKILARVAEIDAANVLCAFYAQRVNEFFDKSG